MFSLFEWKRKEFVATVVMILLVVGISYYQLKICEMKSRDSQRRADTELVARALNGYFKQNGIYPASKDGKIVSCGSRGTGICDWGDSQLVDSDQIVYVRAMPKDPDAQKGYSYVYEVSEDRKKFRIYARLEYKYTPVVKNDLTVRCGKEIECNWYAD